MITASVTEQNAVSITTAFTACEYSHTRRNPLQSSGIVVQLAVAWLAGNVHPKNIAKAATIDRHPTIARTNGARWPRAATARAMSAASARNQTPPSSAQPR